MTRFDMAVIFEVRMAALRMAKKQRPPTLFEAYFFDLREKARAIKHQFEQQAAEQLKAKLIADLNSKGVTVQSAEVMMGNYRGSGFITSFPILVSGVKEPEKLAEYLRGVYSPKWKLKSVTEGVAAYNVR